MIYLLHFFPDVLSVCAKLEFMQGEFAAVKSLIFFETKRIETMRYPCPRQGARPELFVDKAGQSHGKPSLAAGKA